MAAQEHDSLESRPPTKDDFLGLCKSLNDKGVEYIVVGGMAMIQHGYLRTTEDIDLLVKTGLDNEGKIKDALSFLPDKAISELQEGDIEKNTVVRVADEIVIDLMKSACGIDYNEASAHVMNVNIEGINIPFAGLELLVRMKQTVREKDKADLIYLSRLLKDIKKDETRK